VVVEVLPDALLLGEEAGLVGDPGSTGVDQVEHRLAGAQGPLLGAEELLDALLGHRAGLDGVVVGLDEHLAAVELADARDHAVGRQVVVGEVVGEQALLGLEPVLEEKPQALADEQLVVVLEPPLVLLGAALLDLLDRVEQLLLARGLLVGIGRGARLVGHAEPTLERVEKRDGARLPARPVQAPPCHATANETAKVLVPSWFRRS
jgi:hypothetical protein